MQCNATRMSHNCKDTLKEGGLATMTVKHETAQNHIRLYYDAITSRPTANSHLPSNESVDPEVEPSEYSGYDERLIHSTIVGMGPKTQMAAK